MDGQTYASLALKVADEMGIPADKVMTPEQHERFARRFYEMCAEADDGGSGIAVTIPATPWWLAGGRTA